MSLIQVAFSVTAQFGMDEEEATAHGCHSACTDFLLLDKGFAFFIKAAKGTYRRQ